MSENTTIQYSTTYNLNGKGVKVALGAFIVALKEAEWLVGKINSTYELDARLHTQLSEVVAIHIATSSATPGILNVHLSTTGIGFTEETLASTYAILLKAADEILARSPEADLEQKYQQLLEAYRQIAQTADTTLPPEKKGLAWLKDILFTNNPAQAIAWIAIVNILVFIVMAIAGVGIFDSDVEKVIQWGAADKEKVIAGEYWRLFTSCFIHFGIIHLAANMIGLIYASVFLLQVLNARQFLIGYLATGIIGMAVSMWWHTETVTAGASGAIFGCFGMLLGLALTPYYTRGDRITILVYLLFYAGFNLVYGMKDGVDNAAHMGGLLSGIPIGIILYFPVHSPNKKGLQAISLVLVVAFCIGMSAWLIKSTNYYGTAFSRLNDRYNALETEGLLYFKTAEPSRATRERMAKNSIKAFEEAQLVADSMVAIQGMPAERQLYADRLSFYNRVRVEEFKLRLQELYSPGSTEIPRLIERIVVQEDSMLKVFKQ